ncbi:cysteine synthase family protein, partial [Cellulomonas sp. 179-A 4D5 NHS]
AAPVGAVVAGAAPFAATVAGAAVLGTDEGAAVAGLAAGAGSALPVDGVRTLAVGVGVTAGGGTEPAAAGSSTRSPSHAR